MKHIVCVMAIHRREHVTRETIRLLQQQTYPLKDIILVGDSDIERRIAEETGCTYHQTKNRPLGRKWQSGIKLARRKNPDAILINGSDSWLSLNWIQRVVEYIDEGYELIGKNIWHVCRLEHGNPLEIIKRSYGPEFKDVSIGAGRLISRSILDRVHWKLFPRRINSSLDRNSYLRMMKKGVRSLILNDLEDIHILDIKGPWESITTWERIKDSELLVKHPEIQDPTAWLDQNFPEAIRALKAIAHDLPLN